MNKVLFRTDASFKIGSGHVMRCLTLAKELVKQGSEVHFVCRNFPGNLAKTIENDNISVTLFNTAKKSQNSHFENMSIWSETDQKIDIDEVGPILETFQPDWIVVDHYSLDHHWHKKARIYTNNIFVIDDLANRVHDCDILLDQTYGIEPYRYDGLIPTQCHVFSGAKFALLREEFMQLRNKSIIDRQNRNEVKNLLISFGGGDQQNISLMTLEAIEMLAPDFKFKVHLVIGSLNPNKEELCEFIKTSQHECELYINTNAMSDLMAQADLSIGAGGTTTWERCCLGLPTIAIRIADNQQDTISNLHNAGALIDAGKSTHLSVITLSQTIRSLTEDKSRLLKMQNAAIDICDGRGVKEIATSFRDGLHI